MTSEGMSGQILFLQAAGCAKPLRGWLTNQILVIRSRSSSLLWGSRHGVSELAKQCL